MLPFSLLAGIFLSSASAYFFTDRETKAIIALELTAVTVLLDLLKL